MIFDKNLELSDSQALTGTAASTNIVDMTAAGDLGSGEPMALVVQADVAADTADGNETYDIKVEQDTVEAFSSPESVVEFPQLSSFAAGSQVILPIPPGKLTQRYLRAYYTLGGTSPSVTLSAYLVPMSHIQNWTAHPGVTG